MKMKKNNKHTERYTNSKRKTSNQQKRAEPDCKANKDTKKMGIYKLKTMEAGRV